MLHLSTNTPVIRHCPVKFRMIRTILIFFTASVFSNGQILTDSISWNENVSLSSHAGPGSILLVWKIPGSIEQSGGRILRSKNPTGPFEVIHNVDPGDPARFLDTGILDNKRYFYLVEVRSEDGLRYSSDRKAPVFNKSFRDTGKPGDSSGLLPEIRYPADLVRAGVLQVAELAIDEAIVNDVVDLLAGTLKLNPEDFLYGPWLLSLNQFPEILSQLSDKKFISQIHSLNDSIAILARNRALLTPEEWNEGVDRTLRSLKKRISGLRTVVKEANFLLDDLAPLLVTGIYNGGDSLVVEYINLDTMWDNKISAGLRSGMVQVSINSDPRTELFGVPSYLTIKEVNRYLTLTLDNDQVLSYPVPPVFTTAQFTLNGNVVVYRSDAFRPVVYAVDQSGLVLNEIIWSGGNLSLELFGNLNPGDQYEFYLQDSLIGFLNSVNPVFEDFMDTTFYTHYQRDNYPIVVDLKHRTHDGSLRLVESYILPEASEAAAKIPDGGAWRASASATLGKTNTVQTVRKRTAELPMLFALYQNYPNPFNGQTRISFDLLVDARVNLFVTDALGQIVDRFIIDEILDKGTYNFIWDGQDHSSGVYFFTISAEVNGYQPVIFSRKMIYMK